MVSPKGVDVKNKLRQKATFHSVNLTLRIGSKVTCLTNMIVIEVKIDYFRSKLMEIINVKMICNV